MKTSRIHWNKDRLTREFRAVPWGVAPPNAAAPEVAPAVDFLPEVSIGATARSAPTQNRGANKASPRLRKESANIALTFLTCSFVA